MSKIKITFAVSCWTCIICTTNYVLKLGTVRTVRGKAIKVEESVRSRFQLTLNLPTTTIVAQPFNIIKWQLKFNPVA